MKKRRPFSRVQEVVKDMTLEERVARLERHVNDVEYIAQKEWAAETQKIIALYIFTLISAAAIILFMALFARLKTGLL